jgi:hypothetical protein
MADVIRHTLVEQNELMCSLGLAGIGLCTILLHICFPNKMTAFFYPNSAKRYSCCINQMCKLLFNTEVYCVQRLFDSVDYVLKNDSGYSSQRQPFCIILFFKGSENVLTL